MKNYGDLLTEFEKSQSKFPLPLGKVYNFQGMEKKLTYNPSVPFTIDTRFHKNLKVMYVRVESPDANWLDPTVPYDSRAILFYEDKDSVWKMISEEMIGSTKGILFDKMEDPFIKFIRGEIVFGGVVMEFPEKMERKEKIEVDSDAHFDYTQADVTVTTRFYRGKTITTLKPFARIRNMKDVRLCQLKDGSILVATRPQGGEAGVGSIGLTKVQSLEGLNQKAIDNAMIIKDLVSADIKLAALDMYELESGEIGVIGVTAYSDQNNIWHYFGIAFKILNPYEFEDQGIKHTPIKVIARRKNWPEGPTKREQTRDVIFPSGLVKNGKTQILVSGLSDAQVGEIIIPDPFN